MEGEKVNNVEFDILPEYSLDEVRLINSGIEFLERYSLENFFIKLSEELARIGLANEEKELGACLEVSIKNQQVTSCIFPIKEREILIGRDRECKLILANRIVSKKHAKIAYADGLYKIVDLRSVNGTSLNNELLEPMKEVILKSGDIIRIGNFEILFSIYFQNNARKPLEFKWGVVNNGTEKLITKIKRRANAIVILRSNVCAENIYICLPAYTVHTISYKLFNIERNVDRYIDRIGEIELSIIDYLAMRLCFFMNKLNVSISFVDSLRAEKWLKIEETLKDYFLIEVSSWIENHLIVMYILLPQSIVRKEVSSWKHMVDNIEGEIELAVMIGCTKLSFRELMEIDYGDVIMLDHSYVVISEDNSISGEALILTDVDKLSGALGDIVIEGDRLSTRIKSFIKGVNMDNLSVFQLREGDNNLASNDLANKVIETLELNVVIEICRINMSLNEIAEFSEGKLIFLGKDLFSEVNIAVNNKIIGKGRLVKIEGKLGVKIIGLFKESKENI